MKHSPQTLQHRIKQHQKLRQLWIDTVLDHPKSYCTDYVQWVQKQVNIIEQNIKRWEAES